MQTQVTGTGEEILMVRMEADSSDDGSSSLKRGIVLAPKAQKEVSKAFADIKASKFDDAIKHLEAAQHLAPGHPDIPYLLGVVYEKKNDSSAARKYWDQAIQLDPKHVSSLLSCGASVLRGGDPDGARKYLDRGVEAAPNSWRAHGMLATALFRQKLYADAVTHADRAIKLGKEQASSSWLIMGQALAAEGQADQAISALESYLATKPTAALVIAVHEYIDRLKRPFDHPAATIGIEPTTSMPVSPAAPSTAVIPLTPVSGDIPDDPLTSAILRWLPPNVDEAVPPVDPMVACSLENVLQKVSFHEKELPAVVDRYTATEMLLHEDVTSGGYPSHSQKLSFNYLVSIRDQGKFFHVEEYRNGSSGMEMFPDHFATEGLPSIVLLFHPYIISDFDIKCEGLSRMRNRLTWQVYFRQREDKESRILGYYVNGRSFPIALKGRAWIDANNYQVLRIETDLRESHPDLRLFAEHLVMEYGPVKFTGRNEQLWLPASADYYSVSRGHRFHRRHSYADYILFSVDEKQKIGEPKERVAEGTIGHQTPPN
jgi:Flp pilus assembly protein TadD